jgi:Arc/MetJ-type ribon-helix-helix transcriptional regulator
MEIVLDPDLQHFADEQVRARHYRSVSDLVNLAVSLLKAQDEYDADLRKKVAHAIAQLDRGEGRPMDMDAIKARVIARLRTASS